MSTPSLSAAVGRRLYELRVQAGIPLGQLAKRVRLSASALRAIEDGRTHPTIGTLSDLAGQLGSSVPALVREAREIQPGATTSPVLSGPAEIGRAILELPEGANKLWVAETAAIRCALEVCRGNKSAAARLLGVQRQAFARRIEHL